MPDKQPPQPNWPKEHAYGAVLGQEYTTVFQLLRDGKSFTYTVHNETAGELRAVAKFYKRRMIVEEWDAHMTELRVSE